jgi:hypothetical protein
MRRSIRLTGRRQLPSSLADVGIREVGAKRLVTMSFKDPAALRGFPPSAHVTLRLAENKQMEVLDFGTIGAPKSIAELKNTSFGDPSCQVRVADTGTDHLGLLLGSTKTWRLNSDRTPEEGSVRGILRFQPANIAPRAWKLDIQEDAHPIVLVDNRINDPRTWAKTNPVFVACVLPAILHMVFDDILSKPDPADTEWMSDWLRWADTVMTGTQIPNDHQDMKSRHEWIEQLIESFCQRHRLSDRVVDERSREAERSRETGE